MSGAGGSAWRHSLRIEKELAAAKAAQQVEDLAMRSQRAQEIARLEAERLFYHM